MVVTESGRGVVSAQRRAAIYCRVSTAGQEAEGSSLATQEARCRAFAAEQGYVVGDGHVYIETASGAKLWERPKLTALREALRRGEFGAVVVHAVDRLSRNQAHLAILLDKVEREDAHLQCVTEPLDQSAIGKFLLSGRGFVAEVEREKIRERTQRGLVAKLQSGKLRGSNKAIFGYRYANDRTAYCIDEAEAAIVRRVFREALAGRSIRAIAHGLASDGIASTTGLPHWPHASVRVLLHHRAYLGEYAALTWATERRKGRAVSVRRPQEEQIPMPEGVVPPIIDREVWQAVQAVLRRHKVESRRNNRDPEAFLLRGGFARCGHCGRALVSLSATGKGRNGYQLYRTNSNGDSHRECGHNFSISAPTLDREVWAEVVRILTTRELIAVRLAEQQESDPAVADRVAVERALADVAKRQGNIAAAVAVLDDPDASTPLIAELKVLGERKRALLAEREALVERFGAWERQGGALASLGDWVARVGARLSDANYEERRFALTAIGTTVAVFARDHQPRRWRLWTVLRLDDECSFLRNSRSSITVCAG